MSLRQVARWVTLMVGAMVFATACQVGGVMPRGTVSGAGADARIEGLDRARYVSLSAEALAAAMRDGDTDTIAEFDRYAAKGGDDAASSQAIAREALRLVSREQTVAGLSTVKQAAVRVPGMATLGAKRRITFPQDSGMHPLSLTEWWYLNGHLYDAAKHRYGYEFTLFKVGPLLHWVHVAITDEHHQTFQYIRDWMPKRQVYTPKGALNLRYGPHRLRQDGDTVYLYADLKGIGQLSLTLRSRKAPLLINGDGLIDMPEGAYSWYYSQTRLDASGILAVNGIEQPVTGTSWLDHQWGPFFVSGGAGRWDWFSLQFDDDTEYNLFSFRSRQGRSLKRYWNASDAQGRSSAATDFQLSRESWWQSPLTGLFYTTAWAIARPTQQERFELSAIHNGQEMARQVPFLKDVLPHYWEGAMTATKVLPDGRRIAGVAYCEHFGVNQPAALP